MSTIIGIESLLGHCPFDLKNHEPGVYSFTRLLNLSYEEERGESPPQSPEGRIDITTSQLHEPILTGDLVSLLPWNLVQPEVDHSATQMYDDRFWKRATFEATMAVDLARQFFNKRDYITKQYPKKHKLSGSVPRNKSESFECRLALAEYYLTMDRLSVAEYHLRKAIKTHPKESLVISRLLQVLLMKKDYNEANKMAEKAAKLNPKESTTWIAIGVARENMGSKYYKEVEDAYTKSVKIDKNGMLPSFFLASHYLNTERVKDSEKWIRRALKDKSTDLSEVVAKVHTLIQSGKYEDAKKQTQEVIDRIILSWKWQ